MSHLFTGNNMMQREDGTIILPGDETTG